MAEVYLTAEIRGENELWWEGLARRCGPELEEGVEQLCAQG